MTLLHSSSSFSEVNRDWIASGFVSTFQFPVFLLVNSEWIARVLCLLSSSPFSLVGSCWVSRDDVVAL